MKLFVLFAILFSSPVLAGEWFTIGEPDQSDWSVRRVQSYTKVNDLPVPDAVISIADLGIEASVYNDGLPLALEAGATWVSGTSRPGTSGNVAIAGHRDSFFRKLEGVPTGTTIELRTETGTRRFQVETVSVVDALDVWPLDQTQEDVLTLITCFPFRYQGYAPDRYIIRAKLISDHHYRTEMSALAD